MAGRGDAYKPSVLRGYEQALRKRVLPALGDKQLSEIRRSISSGSSIG